DLALERRDALHGPAALLVELAVRIARLREVLAHPPELGVERMRHRARLAVRLLEGGVGLAPLARLLEHLRELGLERPAPGRDLAVLLVEGAIRRVLLLDDAARRG